MEDRMRNLWTRCQRRKKFERTSESGAERETDGIQINQEGRIEKSVLGRWLVRGPLHPSRLNGSPSKSPRTSLSQKIMRALRKSVSLTMLPISGISKLRQETRESTLLWFRTVYECPRRSSTRPFPWLLMLVHTAYCREKDIPQSDRIDFRTSALVRTS